MGLTDWVRREIVNWLGVHPAPIRLSIGQDGSINFGHTDLVLIAQRRRIVAALKSQWAVGLVSAIVGVIVGKLL